MLLQNPKYYVYNIINLLYLTVSLGTRAHFSLVWFSALIFFFLPEVVYITTSQVTNIPRSRRKELVYNINFSFLSQVCLRRKRLSVSYKIWYSFSISFHHRTHVYASYNILHVWWIHHHHANAAQNILYIW